MDIQTLRDYVRDNDIEARDKVRSTSLMHASMYSRNPEVIQVLIDNDACC